MKERLREKLGNSFLFHNGFRRYFARASSLFKEQMINSGWMVSARCIGILVSFFVTIFLANYLGESKYGVFSFALSFVIILRALDLRGTNFFFMQKMIEGQSSQGVLLGTFFFMKLASLTIGFLFCIAAVFFCDFGPDATILILLLSAATLLDSFLAIEFYLHSFVKGKVISIVMVTALLISSGYKILFVLLKLPLIYLAFAWVIEKGLQALLYSIYYWCRTKGAINWKYNWDIARDLLINSYPMIFHSFFVSVYMRIDQVILKFMEGDMAVGQYALAAKLSEMFFFIPSIICTSIYPVVVKYRRQNITLYKKIMRGIYALMISFGICYAVAMTLCGRPAINLLFPDRYLQTPGILLIYSWSSMFVFLNVATSRWFIIEGLQMYMACYAFLGGILNVILNFLLIPVCGVYGAALATVISYFVSSVLCLLLSKKTRRLFWDIILSLNLKRTIVDLNLLK